MSSASDKGPRKLNHDAYKDLQQEQANAHQIKTTNQGEKLVKAQNWRDKGVSQPAAQAEVEGEKLSKHAKRRAKK